MYLELIMVHQLQKLIYFIIALFSIQLVPVPDISTPIQDRSMALWPGGLVPYTIGARFSPEQAEKIRFFMNVLMDVTCVRFEEIDLEDTPKIYLSIIFDESPITSEATVGYAPGA